MKKKYVKDMEKEEIKKILENNSDFYNLVYNDLYTQDLEWQGEEADLMFGKDHYKYIEIHDNYSSFFLTLKNWSAFLDNLDRDYLNIKNADLYNEIMKLKKEYENIACDTIEEEDRFNELEDILEGKSKELLEACEDQLHEYEKGNYSIEDLIDYVMNTFNYEDFYTKDNDCVLYKDQTSCYK